MRRLSNSFKWPQTCFSKNGNSLPFTTLLSVLEWVLMIQCRSSSLIQSRPSVSSNTACYWSYVRSSFAVLASLGRCLHVRGRKQACRQNFILQCDLNQIISEAFSIKVYRRLVRSLYIYIHINIKMKFWYGSVTK